MVQGHAFDGGVAPTAKTSPAYLITRFFAIFPLPSFLFLAGIGVALRVRAASLRNEPVTSVRRRLVQRGLMLVLVGYAVNVAYMFLDDGASTANALRVDVLHAIGLSIVAAAALGLRAESRLRHSPHECHFARVAAATAVVVTFACPWVSSVARGTSGPARYIVGLVADVPGVGKMPFVPLFGWFGAGAVTAYLLTRGWVRAGRGAATRLMAARGPARGWPRARVRQARGQTRRSNGLGRFRGRTSAFGST